jgi:hypothetical protein
MNEHKVFYALNFVVKPANAVRNTHDNASRAGTWRIKLLLLLLLLHAAHIYAIGAFQHVYKAVR